MKSLLPAVTIAALLACASVGTADSAPAGSGAEPDWYYPQWLAAAPYAPVFRVRDTVNKYGRYADETKLITLKDRIKYTWPLLRRLVEGAVALKVDFDILFAGGTIIGSCIRQLGMWR